MRYTQSGTKLVFADLMILLLSVMVGLNSLMSFTDESRELDLPPVNLPSMRKDLAGGDLKAPTSAFITIAQGQTAAGKRYFYNGQEVDGQRLAGMLQAAKVHSVVLRADREAAFKWEEFCRFNAQVLIDAGVKTISYAVVGEEGR